MLLRRIAQFCIIISVPLMIFLLIVFAAFLQRYAVDSFFRAEPGPGFVEYLRAVFGWLLHLPLVWRFGILLCVVVVCTLVSGAVSSTSEQPLAVTGFRSERISCVTYRPDVYRDVNNVYRWGSFDLKGECLIFIPDDRAYAPVKIALRSIREIRYDLSHGISVGYPEDRSARGGILSVRFIDLSGRPEVWGFGLPAETAVPDVLDGVLVPYGLKVTRGVY